MGKVGWVKILAYSLKKVSSMWIKQKQSPRPINRKKQGRKSVPVWLHQEITDLLQGFPCGNLVSKVQNLGIV